MVKWRPHTKKPREKEPTSLLLAFHNSDGDVPDEAILAGIYIWRKGQFVSEYDGRAAKKPFYWTYESELTDSMPKPRRKRGDAANGNSKEE